MVPTRIFRSQLHRHAEPARRVEGIAELPPDAAELALLLEGDPAPEVRAAAANRCASLDPLLAAWEKEADAAVREALAAALGRVLGEWPDGDRARAAVGAAACTDAIRADVARHATDAQRRRDAIAAIRDETILVDLALAAELAETRMLAAERVHAPQALRRLADSAGDRDRGVARLARQRLEAIARRANQASEADAILAEMELVAGRPGPILAAVIDLNRRWEALDLSGDAERLARCEAARKVLQARFDREHEEQRARSRFERRLAEWLANAQPPATAEALAGLRDELTDLRREAEGRGDADACARLDDAGQRIERWAQDLAATAGAEALVVEAEGLAAGTSIDDAKLPERWQALDRAVRTPALTRRFEAALIVIEQRRLAQVRAAEEESRAARAQVHNLLHAAEQALAAGQLHAARAAADEIRARKPDAGLLPKPTVQRIGRLVQELTELERWESFGQRQARVQLCERAEAVSAGTLDPARLAAEVRNLRNEWKALDQQHAGVPKSLWERFDRACEKAYAPAARHFAEQAAQRKQARQQREGFIAAAATHAPTLLAESRDWRAIERWLRETDQRWRAGELGSVEPKAWKTLDERLTAALAPLRDALAAARDAAKARRLALIEEATALAAHAMERDAPSRVKTIQLQWQAQAKELALTQRDERVLWEQFRAACNAVFEAREAKRKQEDDRRHEGHRALEQICAQVEQLVAAGDRDDSQLRRTLRELQEQWKHALRGARNVPRGLESRFERAKSAAEDALRERVRARAAAVWYALAAKERLCEQLEAALGAGANGADAAAAIDAQWAALPELPAAWEKAMVGRRDAAVRAVGDDAIAAAHRARVNHGTEARRAMLLELEMLLGLESPPELKAQRLALQVKQLRERFQSAAPSGSAGPGERLVAWCAEPGVIDAADRARCERVFAAVERQR